MEEDGREMAEKEEVAWDDDEDAKEFGESDDILASTRGVTPPNEDNNSDVDNAVKVGWPASDGTTEDDVDDAAAIVADVAAICLARLTTSSSCSFFNAAASSAAIRSSSNRCCSRSAACRSASSRRRIIALALLSCVKHISANMN